MIQTSSIHRYPRLRPSNRRSHDIRSRNRLSTNSLQSNTKNVNTSIAYLKRISRKQNRLAVSRRNLNRTSIASCCVSICIFRCNRNTVSNTCHSRIWETRNNKAHSTSSIHRYAILKARNRTSHRIRSRNRLRTSSLQSNTKNVNTSIAYLKRISRKQNRLAVSRRNLNRTRINVKFLDDF